MVILTGALFLIAHAVAPRDPYGLRAQRTVLTAIGAATVHGARQTFRFTFDRSFHYRLDVDGPIPQTDGFDGKTSWSEGPSRVPHETSALERDAGRAVAWAMSGEWSDRKAPLTLTPGRDPASLTLKPKDGVAAVQAKLDPKTGYLVSLTYAASSGNQNWEFSSFKSFAGRTLPTRVVLHDGAQDDVYEIDSVTPDNEPNGFHMPPADPGAYDPSVSPQVPVKRVGGYLFVRPTLNGQDAGWFFLDSGADVCCIDPDVVKALALPKVGSDTTAGAVAVSQLDLYRADTLQIGPETLRHPVLLGLDLKDISRAIGFRVVGICGYDFLARCTVDVDPRKQTIQVNDAAYKVPDSGLRWLPMRFNGNTPVVTAAFSPNHTGEFQLDTGSGSTVDFFSPTVRANHLDQTPGATKAKTMGAGGGAESLQGHITWFELGGTRLDNPKVGFQLAKTGAFANPFLAGNIGMGFMSKYRVVFDYPHRRVGFQFVP